MEEFNLLTMLSELELMLQQPKVRCSREQLMQLLHKDFVEVGRSGKRYSREEVVEHLVAEPSVNQLHARDFHVVVLSDSAALLTYCTGNGETATQRASIWVREADAWQIIYHQGTSAALA